MTLCLVHNFSHQTLEVVNVSKGKMKKYVEQKESGAQASDYYVNITMKNS